MTINEDKLKSLTDNLTCETENLIASRNEID